MYDPEFIKVLASIQHGVKAHGVKALAARLSVHTQTLYADVDPGSIGRKTNKLGFLDWLVILKETQNFVSLDEANRVFGRISLPLPLPADEMTDMGWLQYCATIAKESAEAIKILAEGISNGDLDQEERDRCAQETWEALQAFAGLYIALRGNTPKLLTIT